MKTLIGILILCGTFAFSQTQEEIENSFVIAYGSYKDLTQDYLDNQKKTQDVLRRWRRSLLTDTYGERLESIEKNLKLSNKTIISSFESFIEENGSGSLDDVLMLRLAQLHFEKANLEFNDHLKEYQRKLDLYSKGLVQVAPEPPVPSYSKTIQFLDSFLKVHPQSLLRDRALYLTGFCFEEMGDVQKASLYYSSLARDYVNSDYYEEVLWRLADIYFNQNKVSESERLYLTLSQRESSFRWKSLYRLGATYFSKKEFEKSREAFETLIGFLNSVESLSREDSSLVEEGYEYLAAILSQNPQIQIAPQFREDVYYKLGQVFKRRVDEESMRKVYTYAIQEFPKSKWLPRMYSDLIRTYEDDGNVSQVNAYRNKLVSSLASSDTWWAHNDKYKLAIFEAQDLLEYNLLKSAQFYAVRGYKNDNYELLEMARTRYFHFVKKYPWSPYAERAKLELADIEYFLERYAIASQHYFELVNQAESASIREEAGYSLIWSESKKVRYDLSFSNPFYLSQEAKKSPLSLQENVFIQAASYYVNKIERSPRRNKVLYKMAEIYVSHGELDMSAQMLNLIISNVENSDMTTLNAYRLLGNIYNIKNDWRSVQVVSELQKTHSYAPNLEDLKIENQVLRDRERLEPAFNAELEGRYAEAISQFEEFLISNPRSSSNLYVQLRLVSLYDRQNQLSKMQDMILKLEKGAYSAEALFYKAQMYFRQSLFDDASNLFEEFSRKHSKHAWFSAAVMNVLSMKLQMKQYKKISTYIEKMKLEHHSPYLFYVYLDALYNNQSYDKLIQIASSYPKKQEVDSSYIMGYILKSYYEKDDFLALEKVCPSIKPHAESKNRASYMSYNVAFCKFVDMRATVSAPETQTHQIQSDLNEISRFNVDEVTLYAVNTVLEQSNLKVSQPELFYSFAERGWSLARQSPFSRESKRLAKNYHHSFAKYPIHLGQLMNWRLGLYNLYSFAPIPHKSWRDLQAQCEGNMPQCSVGLEKIYALGNPSEDVYLNLVLSYLNQGNDQKAIEFLNQYAQSFDWPQKAVDLYFVLGISERIPKEKLSYEGQLSTSLGILAVIERQIEEKNLQEALKFIRLNLGINPQYPQTYARAAQLYYDRGYPELARTVLQNGVVATQAPVLESLLYQLNAVTYSNTDIGQVAPGGEVPEKYALGFAAIKTNNKKIYDSMLASLKTTPAYQESLKLVSGVYKGEKVNLAESSPSYHVRWLSLLQKFSNLQNPANLEELKEISRLGYKHPALPEVDQIMNSRVPAGEM